MFNKINNINTYRNCLYNLNTIDIISVFPKRKIINSNLSKSNQIPLTTLSTNFKNQTSNLNQPLKSNLNNKIISQENENISNSFHTLSSNSKVFRINNISFEPSVEIVQLENQYNTMIEKTTQSLEEELQSVDLNEDFESNFIENEDISLVDNKKDVDVITESDNDSDDAKTKINEGI